MFKTATLIFLVLWISTEAKPRELLPSHVLFSDNRPAPDPSNKRDTDVVVKPDTTGPSLDDLGSDQREVLLSTGLLILLCSVVACLFTSHICKCLHVDWLPSPLIAIVFGMIVGAILRFAVSSHRIILDQVLNFNDDIFFIALLPPIVFESGFSLSGEKAQHFFKNFGAILWFAIFATLVSFGAIGTLFFIASSLHLCQPFSLRESFAFGAIMSSTDPVAALSLLNSSKAHPLLFSLIYGESLMNDAFSIVLYRTVVHAQSKSLPACLVEFAVVFFGSVGIGVAVGLISALVYKYMNLHKESNLLLESALLPLFVWISYLVSDGLSMSGIVSILFSGITTAHYTQLNLSPVGQKVAKSIFGTLSLLAETVVLILLGIAVFSAPLPSSLNWGVYTCVLVILPASRVISVFLTSFFVNLFRRRNKISSKFQHIINLCGVRGAVAFALALRSRHDFGESPGASMLSVTLFYAIITLLLISVLLPILLKRLEVRTSDELPPTDIAYEDFMSLASPPHSTESPPWGFDKNTSASSLYYGEQAAEEELYGGVCGGMKKMICRLDDSVMKPFFTSELPRDRVSPMYSSELSLEMSGREVVASRQRN